VRRLGQPPDHRRQAGRDLSPYSIRLIIAFEFGQRGEPVMLRLIEGLFASAGAVAPVVGDHVAGHLVGPGVQPLLVAEPPHVGVQPQEDLLREVVDDGLVGDAAGDERAQTLVQFRPHHLRRRGRRVERTETGGRYRHPHAPDAAVSGGQQRPFSDGSQHADCSLLS
jgi:hypothetical protein